MKKLLCAAIIIAAFSCNKDDNNNNVVSQMDRDFMMNASVTNTAEIQAGQLASTKASDTAIKSFGLLMVAEHTTAQNDLKALGASVNVGITDSADAATAALMAQLNALSGRAFDSAYINSQVTGHQEAIDLFTNEINSGNSDAVQAYANTYLPHIQMHKAKADSIAASFQ